MAIVEIKIDAIESFADGQAFGNAGSYLRIKGIAKGEIDPVAPENRVIADLDKAPSNAHGMVEYAADFFILRPADLRRANSVLVYDVTNRGRKMILNLLTTLRATPTPTIPKQHRMSDWASPSRAATASSGPDGIPEHRAPTTG